MSIHWLDILILVFYFFAMGWLGWYFSKKNKSTDDYFAGGRSFGAWVIGISLVGYSISSVTFIAYPGDAFKTGWSRYLINITLPLALIGAAYIFIPFFRRINVPSAYKFLEDRFGPSIRLYVAIAFILSQFARLSIILYLVAIVVHEMTGIDPLWCILIAGLVTAFYTVLGGLDAVIWTDVIQALVLLGGGAICLTVILMKLPGGLETVINVATADSKLAFTDIINGRLQPVGWGLSLSERTGTMLMLLGLFNWLSEYSSSQNTVQRYIASRSTREARKAVWICGLSSLPIWALFMFVGTALYVFFKQFPTAETTAMLAGDVKAEQVLPFFIMHYLPPGLTGLIIAAILAAAMSSLSASLNAISTVSIIDFYQRFMAPGRSDRHYLKAAWFMTSVVSIVMIFGAIVLIYAPAKTLLDTSTILTSVLAGGLLGIYMLGIFSRVGDARAVWLGICCTVAYTVWQILSDRDLVPAGVRLPFDLYYTTLIGNVLMFIVAYTAGLLIFKQRRNVEHLTFWTQHKASADPTA